MAKAKHVTSESTPANPGYTPPSISSKHKNHLKVLGTILTLAGICLFSYFVYSVGVNEIVSSVQKFGIDGFAIILAIYFARIVTRASAWSLSVYEPYYLKLRHTIPAVIIGEAMSSMIPLGILISGTAKAVAVRKRVPLVVGLSSIATENLFYSFTTSIFLILGGLTLVRSFEMDEGWIITIDILLAAIGVVFVFLIAVVVRQWHFASETCEWLFQRGFARGLLEHGRMQVRLFENFIYGFYRRYPRRFLPICLIEAAFHLLGILEVWFVLGRISEAAPSFVAPFLLESVSRLITIVFKLVPFLIGVDEAGAQFVAEIIGVGIAVGITLAIIRKGRILFWTAVGLGLIIKRGLSLREISEIGEN